MKRFLMILLTAALMFLSAPCALAADELTANRTSYGMEISVADGTITIDGKVICAAYDGEGKMLAAELVSPEEAAELTVYCDVNEVRQVRVFTVGENLQPIKASAEEELDPPKEPIHVHTWKDGTVTKPADCETTGLKVYLCTDANCDDPNQGPLEENIPALGHSWSDWVYTDANTHTHTCTHDATHTEAEAHAWDNGTVTKEPTETETGTKEYICTDCGGTKTEVVPVLNPKDVYAKMHNGYLRIYFPADVCGLTLPADSKNMESVIEAAALTWGDTAVYSSAGKYIFYDAMTDQFYFSLSLNSYQNLSSGLQKMTLTLTPTDALVFPEPITLTNEEFVFESVTSDQPFPQDFDAEYKFDTELNRIMIGGLDTSMSSYSLTYMRSDRYIQTIQLNYDSASDMYWFYCAASTFSQMEGYPYSITSINVTTTGQTLTLTRSKPVFPLYSGRFLGGTSAADPGSTTIAFTPGNNGSIRNGVITLATDSTGTYTHACAIFYTDSVLLAKNQSMYGLQSDGKTLQQNGYLFLPEILNYFQRTDVTDSQFYMFFDLYNLSDMSKPGSAQLPKTTFAAVEGDPIIATPGIDGYARVHLTTENDFAYITGTPGCGNAKSSLYNSSGNFYLHENDIAGYTSPALWTWDGVIDCSESSEYTIQFVYHPIIIE